MFYGIFMNTVSVNELLDLLGFLQHPTVYNSRFFISCFHIILVFPNEINIDLFTPLRVSKSRISFSGKSYCM